MNEIERLREALRAIDRRNDSMARFDSEINAIVRAALSQQADTCPACNGTGEGTDIGDCALVACMCNGTGKIPKAEPHLAKDERNPTSADYLAARAALESCDWSNVPIGTKAILGRVVDLLWLAAHATEAAHTKPTPAQDEREAFKRALHSQKVFKLSSATIDAAEWAWFHRPTQTVKRGEAK